MHLTVNGRSVTIPNEVKTIEALIKHFELTSPIIIVEHNDLILDKNDDKNIALSEGDKVELIQFVGGG